MVHVLLYRQTELKKHSTITTVYIFTHVLMLICISAISWLAAGSDNENIDLEIKLGKPSFRTNQIQQEPVKSGNMSFGKILFIKEMPQKNDICPKEKVPIIPMLLTLVLITLMIGNGRYLIHKIALPARAPIYRGWLHTIII
jgi:hypothetical protein